MDIINSLPVGTPSHRDSPARIGKIDPFAVDDSGWIRERREDPDA